jgi:hypothetical protein
LRCYTTKGTKLRLIAALIVTSRRSPVLRCEEKCRGHTKTLSPEVLHQKPSYTRTEP